MTQIALSLFLQEISEKMSKLNKPPVWKRPKTKIYDYNYNLGEHYYKPQLRHADGKFMNRAASPPKAKTFAERFAEDPVYGNNSPYDYRKSSGAEQPAGGSTIFDSPFGRRTSLQDGELGGARRPLFDRGLTPDLDDIRPARPRINLGERVLDAARGIGSRSISGDANFGTGLSAEDPFEDPFFQRRRLLPPRSADPDLLTEDPFKRRLPALTSGVDDDEFFSSAKRDTDSIVSGFRDRMKARKLRLEGAEDEAPFESRLDRIKSRAKARMDELEDDLPRLSLRSGRGISALSDLDDLESSFGTAASASSKTLKISKRTVRATTTVETD